MQNLVLIVSIAGERVAIPAASVESVVELEGLAPVPRAPAHIAGLSALRSRVVTVVDCRAALEFGSSDTSGMLEAIVVEVEGHPYALLVDGVEDVLEYSGEVRSVRTALGRGWQRVAQGMIEAGKDILLLVDPDALIAGPATIAA